MRHRSTADFVTKQVEPLRGSDPLGRRLRAIARRALSRRRPRRVLIGMFQIGTLNPALQDALARRNIASTMISWETHPFYDSGQDGAGPSSSFLARVRRRLRPYKAVLFPRRVEYVGLASASRREHTLLGILLVLRTILTHDTFIFVFGGSMDLQNRDLPLLRFLRRTVVMVFLGCDIRARDAVLPLGRPFATCTDCTERCVAAEKQARARKAARYADLVLAQPEYAQYLSEYAYFWFPLDIRQWTPVRADNPRPRVVHAPSHTGIKGTKYVNRAIAQLRDEGVEFDFVVLHNRPHTEIREELERCDIVVDQLMAGWYGLLTLEAMALGKCVLTYISSDLERAHGVANVPVLSTNPATVVENLRQAIADAALRDRLGQAAREFVEAHHDADRVVGDVLRLIRSGSKSD